MLRKVSLWLLLAAIVAGAYYSYIAVNSDRRVENNCYHAIPVNALFILDFKSKQDLWAKISGTNIIWDKLLSNRVFGEINRNLIKLDTLGNRNEIFKEINSSQSLLSFHKTGVKSFEFLLVSDLPGLVRGENIIDAIKSEGGGNVNLTSRTYDGADIYNLKLKKEDLELYFVIHNNFFAISQSSMLAESVVKHLNSGESIKDKSIFNNVFKSSSSTGVDGHIYINFDQVRPFAETLFSDEFYNSSKLYHPFAGWAGYDFSINPNTLFFNGIVMCSGTNKSYLKIFYNQKPQKINLTEVIPQHAIGFKFIGVSDFDRFHVDYLSYLRSKGEAKKMGNFLENFQRNYGRDLKELLTSWIGNEMGVIVPSLKGSHIAVFGAGNMNRAQDKLMQLATALNTGQKVNFEGFEIINLYNESVFQTLLGPVFEGVKANYYVIVGNYVLFSESIAELKSLLKAYNTGKTITKDLAYVTFSENLSDVSSWFVYSNIPKSIGLYKEISSDKVGADLEDNKDILQSFEGIGWQVSNYKNDMLLSNMFIKYNPADKRIVGSLWESNLGAPISTKPYLVTNHYTKTKEVFVQDDSLRIHLISNKGNTLWKRNIQEKILGDISQIDIYKNGKLQYLFSTATKIYLVDRNGKDVDNFPISLDKKATCPVSYVDYDKNRNYRFLIGTEGGMVQNYGSDGKKVKGWIFKGAKGDIFKPLEHFKIGNKDYIYTISGIGEVLLLDRRGEIRHRVRNQVENLSSNEVFLVKTNKIKTCYIVAANSDGNIVKFKFNGTQEKIKLGEFGPDFKFLYFDLNGDRKKDYVFCDGDKLFAYNLGKTLIYKQNLSSVVTDRPVYYLSSRGSKVALTSSVSDEIHIVEQGGKLHQNSPFYGSTVPAIGDINRDGKLDVVVGSDEGKIYVYSLN